MTEVSANILAPPLLLEEESRRPSGWDATARAYAAAVAAVATAWLCAPLAVDDPTAIRTALAVAGVLTAAAALAVTARHTDGRERLGWVLALAGTLGAMLPVVGSLAGIAFGIGVLLVACGDWLSDRHRLVDGALVLLTIAAATSAYVFPAGGARDGAQTFDHFAGATQVTLAVACVVLAAYRCRPSVRPDVWLLAGGFIVGTATGMPALVVEDLDHASAWLPHMWWEIGLPLAGLTVAAGAALRRSGPRSRLGDLPGLTAPNAAAVGDLALLAVVVAFAVAPPPNLWIALPLLGAALVVRNVRSRIVEQDNRRLAEQRLSLYRASFLALASAIEARDGYTHQHSEETVALVQRVAERLGLSPAELSELKTVALLHDVGKIGIPDHVLHKPGALEPGEWEVMRRHPVIGERILRSVPGLDGVALAIRHEHERWDGTGYPDGLAGEAIPLPSRVVLVCDAYHAMTSDRPYRQRMSDADALRELRRCAGAQFDPRVVEALCEVASPAA